MHNWWNKIQQKTRFDIKYVALIKVFFGVLNSLPLKCCTRGDLQVFEANFGTTFLMAQLVLHLQHKIESYKEKSRPALIVNQQFRRSLGEIILLLNHIN